ncbi:hypothetical protein LMG27177_00872 [Paraburkholderia fynbosensis]|uniref:Uncharacterized protein n=1 Tax=Paraburkholderia fynbosensis TaxID=1200993 RepID=A0A6J5FI27_9BURK|nr:hypothetical protein LMG27177_00872 [Paraburkholderia fynbosensis]
MQPGPVATVDAGPMRGADVDAFPGSQGPSRFTQISRGYCRE